MKKLWIDLLSLFLLTGCGQKPETPVPPSDPSPTQQEPNEPPVSPEPETPARAEQVDLTFFVEGEEEALPATLYVGDGYSLYIPDEDWDGPEQSTENGVPTDTWVSAFNSDVALSVSRYLAIATLGFAEIIRAIFQWDPLGPVTNGANALKNFPTFSSFNIQNADGKVILRLSTFVPFLLAGVCVAVIVLLLNSTYGRAFKAIRDDEVAAEAMGINLARHKRLAFSISSFLAREGGGLFAMFANQAQAKVFTTAMTYEILLIVVIGGIGSISGSCIAAFLYVAASEWWLRFLDAETYIGSFKVPFLRTGFRMVVFSVIIMVVVLFFRKGIMGDKELPDLLKKRQKKAKKEAVQP